MADGSYVRLQNVAADKDSEFDCTEEFANLQGEIVALVHSHPNGTANPSRADMQAQHAMDLPWGILFTNGKTASDPYFWGDSLTPPPLEGRQFRHGPSGTDNKGDCYALIRDYYRMHRGVILPEFPRDWEWWLEGGDLYRDGFTKAGFSKVSLDDVQPGDVVFVQIKSPVPNHAGILLDGGHILHHLQDRYSRIEAIGNWRRFVNFAARYVGHG